MKCLFIIPAKINRSLGKIKATFLLMLFISVSISSFSQDVAFDKNEVDNHTEVSKQSELFSFGLLSFKARHKGNNKVVLSWSMANEANTSHFIMQRSKNGIDYNDAAVVFTFENNGVEKVDYNYVDNINPEKSGQIFYRLKIVDTNGKPVYSGTVIVSVEKMKEEMYWLIACK